MNNQHHILKSCIEACYSCATVCEHCATECLKEDDIKMMALCISLTRECALICNSSASLMSMGGDHARALCHLCADLCEACADECEKFVQLEHCRRCEIECRRCAEECRVMMDEHAMY